MFITVLLAVVLSQILGPLVGRIEHWTGLSRGMATLSSFILTGASLLGAVFWTMPFLSKQFKSLEDEIPKYIQGLGSLVNQVETKMSGIMPFVEDVGVTYKVKSFLMNQVAQIAGDLPVFITSSFSVFFLCPLLAFFMIRDSHKLSRGFLSLVPNHVFETTLSLTHQIGKQIGKFIRVRIFEAFIVGLITGVGLQIISFPFALILGLFAALMNLVPYVGPVIGFIPAFLIAVVNNMPLSDISIVVGVYVFAQIIDNVVLIPILVAHVMKLHPVTVVVVVIAGAQFLGILGMIISIPVANAVQVAYHAVYQHIISEEVTR